MAKKTKLEPQTLWAGLKLWLTLAMAVFMVGALPIMHDFLYNRYEVAVQDLVLPLAALALIAAFVASVFYGLYRRQPLAGLIATLLAGVLLTNNYDARLGNIYPVLSAIVPLPKLDGLEASIYSLIFILAIFWLARWIGVIIGSWVHRRKWNAPDIVVGMMIAITISFTFLLVPTIKFIASAWPQYFYKPPKLATSTAPATAKPDIYYIVLEDYASNRQLTNQFNFTNAAFSDFLTASGYTLNPDAHQNYPYTTMSIASTLNAGYNTNIINEFGRAKSQTIVPYHRAVQYSSVVATLKSLGYSYDQIGTWYETTNHGPLANNFFLNDRQLVLFGHTGYINGYTQEELSNGPFWRFLQNGINIGHFTIAHYIGESQVQLTADALGRLKTLAEQPAGGRLIFAHLIIPHEPFYYNADGSLSDSPGNNNNGKPIKDKYIGQVQYINSQLEPILATIKHKSGGQAVVILQSDEGPQPVALNDHVYNQDDESTEINHVDMRSWNDADLALKYGSQAAYSIPAASPNDLAAGANHVNVFRLVLNRYFGANLPLLPECYYAYPNGRGQTFVYRDITQRLTGQANAACANDGTGPK